MFVMYKDNLDAASAALDRATARVIVEDCHDDYIGAPGTRLAGGRWVLAEHDLSEDERAYQAARREYTRAVRELHSYTYGAACRAYYSEP